MPISAHSRTTEAPRHGLYQPTMTWNTMKKYLAATPAVLNAYVRLRQATHVGRGARVWGRPYISNEGTLIFGERVRISSIITPSEFVVAQSGRLEIGEHVFINRGATLSASHLIRIGAHSMIGIHSILMDNDLHHSDPDKRYAVPPSKPIIIEHHVWIGARVTILKGVTIGEYAVVGAGSVVTRDIPPYAVAAGNPAKIIRHLPRPNDRQIHRSAFEELLQP